MNGRPVTIEDTVMDNEDIAVTVARDMILPRDEIMLAARTDIANTIRRKIVLFYFSNVILFLLLFIKIQKN